MLEILLAAHVTQIDTLYRRARREEMEEAFYRARLGRIARAIVACLLLTPLVSLLADYLI